MTIVKDFQYEDGVKEPTIDDINYYLQTLTCEKEEIYNSQIANEHLLSIIETLEKVYSATADGDSVKKECSKVIIKAIKAIKISEV